VNDVSRRALHAFGAAKETNSLSFFIFFYGFILSNSLL
jgi:hypothetical protein